MRWKSRTTAFLICYTVGVFVAFIYAALLGLFKPGDIPSQTTTTPCATAEYFNRPEEVLANLKSAEVSVRRATFRRLFLRPGISTVYYDYERDLNYPERADRARLQYLQLDDSPDEEALLTFVRFEHPVALVFQRKSCGWQVVGALSSWLRFEDYPYETWISLPETMKPGVHELMVRDSTGDSASYVRKVRLLRLVHGVLQQVAEFAEEEIEPVNDYKAADWNNVKRKRFSHVTFVTGHAGQSPLIEIETTAEIIKFAGPALTYSYWLETDGSWHAQQANWNERPGDRIKLLGVSKQQLVWNSHEERFVNRDQLQ